MVFTNLKDVMSRMDIIQQGIWNTEEKVIRNLANHAKQKTVINEVQSKINLILQKIDKIDLEIRGLRTIDNNHGN